MALTPAQHLLAILGASFLLLSFTAYAEPYSTLVPATHIIAGAPIPVCCCVTLDDFHFSAAQQGLLATSAVTSGLDPKCGTISVGVNAACLPTVCPSFTFTEVPIGIALLGPKLGSFAINGHGRKLLQAGTQDYVTFASTFNITGELHVSTSGEKLNVKLDDMKLGTTSASFDESL